jgi:ribose transport system ATP-binding protein
VHGLLGQNGSRKSTLIKILAGYHAPDAGGTLAVRGERVELPLRPADPRRLGLAFVHQDLALVDTATVLENLRVGRYETRAGWRIPWRRERQAVRAALARFGLGISPDASVASLREVDRAMVAILRALEQLRVVERGVLVLDEPTAYLPRDGVERLFAAVREIAGMGFAVLFVTHRLEEVTAITDRVSVLRDGALVACEPTASLDEAALIERILGFSLDDLYPEPHHARGDVVLRASGVSGSLVRDFSFELRRGEILGITGLLGMGWEQVPYLLFGAEPALGGELEILGRRLDLGRLAPREAMAAGIALLPANRLRDGSAPLATVTENMTLATLPRYYRNGLLRRRAEQSTVYRLMGHFDVRPREPGRSLSTLSGGNQQKVLIAKWFATHPRVFLMHEPTQGVDVGARRQIFSHIRTAVEDGMPVVLASSEYEDLANLCDRVIVFRHGRPVSELAGETLTHARIVEQCFRRGEAA